ncbi:16499_t:CDS:2, partial [Gigaspora rosea]
MGRICRLRRRKKQQTIPRNTNLHAGEAWWNMDEEEKEDYYWDEKQGSEKREYLELAQDPSDDEIDWEEYYWEEYYWNEHGRKEREHQFRSYEPGRDVHGNGWYEEEEFEVYLAITPNETDPHETGAVPQDPTSTQNSVVEDQRNVIRRPILDEGNDWETGGDRPNAEPEEPQQEKGAESLVERASRPEYEEILDIINHRLKNSTGSTNQERPMDELLEKFQIRHLKSTLYHPQTNGLVERFNKMLCEAIAKSIKYITEWNLVIPAILFAYRTSKHSVTKFTPFYLMHGREAQQPIQPEEVGELETLMERTATLLEHLPRVQNEAVIR